MTEEISPIEERSRTEQGTERETKDDGFTRFLKFGAITGVKKLRRV